MVKPVTREMYSNPPPPPQWSQPPPPYHGHGRPYHYGQPHPPPPPTSSHPRYPPQPIHHGHAPRSPHHGYYVSGRGAHQHRHADVPTSSPPSAPQRSYTQPIQISPQTPHHGPPRPPPTHRPPVQYSPSRVTSTKLQAIHTPVTNRTPDPIHTQTNNTVTSKPPRPYTEYTMFYQLEREYILHRLLVDQSDPKAQAEIQAQAATALFKEDPLMPARYRTLPLQADWYISGKSKKPSKRKHRKTHGKIGFLELTRMIAARWAEVDDETRKYCKMMAAMELVKYKEDVESYNAYKARLEEVGEVPEDEKEKERKKMAKSKRMTKGAAGGTTRAATTAVADKRQIVDPVKSGDDNRPFKKDDVDNDMEDFITSLDEERTTRKKRVSSPPPLPSSADNQAPWNHFLPGPRRQHRHVMPPMTVQSKVVTPERSSKRRRCLPTRYSPGGRYNDPPAMPSGPVSPEDELIHMTFSGIDEDAIAREFYYPSHMNHNNNTGVSPGMASGVSASPNAMSPAAFPRDGGDGEAHPTNAATEALYGPPVQSFDYWDALMDPPADEMK